MIFNNLEGKTIGNIQQKNGTIKSPDIFRRFRVNGEPIPQ